MHAHDLHMSLSCPLYPSSQQCDSELGKVIVICKQLTLLSRTRVNAVSIIYCDYFYNLEGRAG